MLTQFSNDEVLKIASSLEDYHKVFYTFFEMTGIYYDDSIGTAAVQFYPDANPDLLICREFWEKLDHRERLFVICHECLHVILLHNLRNGGDIKGATPKLVNIAQDITINEMIVFLFGFNREDLREWKKFCWIDTCFDDPTQVKKHETFDYYLQLLIKEQKQDLPETLDEHGQGNTDSNSTPGDKQDIPQAVKDKIKEVAGKLAEDLTQGELDAIINSFDGDEAGTLGGMYENIIGSKAEKVKVNFNKLVRHLKRTRIKEKLDDRESFVSEDRRFADVIKRSNVTLPGKIEQVRPMKDRLLTVLFMDVSGSCIDYYNKFVKVYLAFKSEHELFEIRSFAFDTRVTEIEPGDKVTMGGGTRYDIIEAQVQKLKIEYGKYPDCVMVVSDGEGNSFAPELPKRWVWLLTPRPMYQLIPSSSKKYLLSDVIF